MQSGRCGSCEAWPAGPCGAKDGATDLRPIETEADIAGELAALLVLDPCLAQAAAEAGPLPLRRGAPGLGGLVSTVLAQQVSRASAAAIEARLRALVDTGDAAALHAADDGLYRAAGLSGAKVRTLRALAVAVLEGRLEFRSLADLPAADAVARLTAVHGIGRWTAECHLLFSLGHRDVFPAGDLALQVAAQHALALPERPGERQLAALAARWSPHRAVAARLLWAHYHVRTRRDAAPAETSPRNAEVGGKQGLAPPHRAAPAFTKATR